jgi:signal transduction histidine kinase
LSEDGKRLNQGAAPSLPESYNRAADAHEIGPLEGSCGTAAFTRQQVIATDVATDPRWANYKHIALEFGLRACWSTPIFSKRGQLLGTFAMYYREPASPTPAHRSLIATATHLAGIAIEHAQTEQERERLVSELKVALQARDEFLSIASHELRTPLTSLKLQAQYLMLLLKDSPEAIERTGMSREHATEKCVVSTLRQIDRLQSLVAELLDVSCISAGRLPLKLERVNLGEVAEEVSERFQDVSVTKGSSLTIRVDGQVWGNWDRTRLDQVLTNLLTNAFKFGQGGPVSIVIDGDEQRARLRVRDSGIGIPAEQQSSLFRRFERGDQARHYGGLGLGLWISRQIVDALGGTIGVESQPGQGTTFIVELPREPSELTG